MKRRPRMGTETNKALAERVDAILNTGAGHWFDGLIEFLTWESSQKPAPGRGRNRPSARPDCRPGRHEGRADGGRLAVPHPGGPKREARRPNGAPAYYLGRPAHIYITAMRPHRHAASDHPEQAVTGGGETTAITARPLPGRPRGRNGSHDPCHHVVAGPAGPLNARLPQESGSAAPAGWPRSTLPPSSAGTRTRPRATRPPG